MKERHIIFNAENESWLPVVGYVGRYEISNTGIVRSLTSYHGRKPHTTMSPFTNNKGYQYVTLRDGIGGKKSHAIHRMVLEAFVEKCPEGKQVAHWNGDPSDNRVENLRWASSKENIDDRARHGRTAKGEEIGASKLDRKSVKTIKRLKSYGLSACEVAHLACVNPSTILKIWDGKSWKHV